MGRRGPAPTPKKILQIRGSWRAKKGPAEPELPVESPDCPAWLDKEAKAEWARQIAHLETIGLVAKADRAMLAFYCEAVSEAMALMQSIKKLAYAKAISLGLVNAKNKAIDRAHKLGQQFGFSPSARARLNAPEEKEKAPSGKSRFFSRN